LIAPLIPPAKPGGIARTVDMREVVNTILYLSRVGCQWRFIPHDLLPKSTVWDYFKAWKTDGTLQHILDALRRGIRKEAGREEDPSATCIDTQTVRTHHQGADSTVDGGKKVKGRKRHIIVDTLGLLLAVAVTAGSLHDGRSAPRVLGKLSDQTKRRLEAIFADSKYNTEPLRDWVVGRGDTYRIVVVSRPEDKSFVVLKKRWVVERTFAWMGWNRRLSKDYERTTTSSEAWVQISLIHLMVRRLSPSKGVTEFRFRLSGTALSVTFSLSGGQVEQAFGGRCDFPLRHPRA
jgi:putative transposase